MYRFLRALLFLLPAEMSHDLGLKGLALCHRLGLSALLRARVNATPVELFGLQFPNAVGLAAGLDKNADYVDALAALGFGFIEVGTVTPKAQPGNSKPRLFRLRQDQAIINRMGFNNLGLEHMVARLRARRFRGIVGVNIGKNLSTPVEQALDDYLTCLRSVYAHADYIVVNLSSPNTPGLRQLQFGTHLQALLAALQTERETLASASGRRVPLLVKIAPDMTASELDEVAAAVQSHGMDGISATNTTISREGLRDQRQAGEAGGLSGAPLAQRSTDVVAHLRRVLGPDFPIIAIGGIHDVATAAAKRNAGASLLQVYTGFIYRGPVLIAEACVGFDSVSSR